MLQQLRRRNVHRVALAYLAGAWLVVQVVDTLEDMLPAGTFNLVVVALAIGFLPSLVLAWVFEWTPDGIRREGVVATDAPPPDSRLLDRAIILMLTVAVTYFVIDEFLIEPDVVGEQIEVARIEAIDSALSQQLLEKYRDHSVLVAPFRSLSADPDQAYFGDSLAGELRNQLTKVEELRVISGSSSGAFKDDDIDVIALQKKFDLSHILAGRVQKAGDRIRISTELIDARSNRVLWSEHYDRTLDDIFAIQDEISAVVVDQLKLTLLAGPPSARAINPLAYDLYLQGRHLTHTVRTEQAFDEAIEVLEHTVDLEPDYVPAVWELARAIYNSTIGDAPAESSGKNQRVRMLVDRLVATAPDSSYANGWLATFAEDEGNMQLAALYQERAVAAANDSNLYLHLAISAKMLLQLNRIEESIALSRYVVNRDPACTACVNVLAIAFRRAGRHRKAAEELEQLLEHRAGSPGIYWNTGVAWLVAGEPERALPYFEHSPPGNDTMGRLMVLYSLGRQEEFEKSFADMRAENGASAEGIARVAAWSGNNDLAFEQLERAIDIRGPGVATAVRSSADLYRPITSDPRWQALLDRYDAGDEDLSRIRFNPKLPAEVRAALAAAG